MPDATLTHDTRANTIVAWASKSDQETIAAALKRLNPGDDPARRPHVVSYSVGTADPNAIHPLITALVPTARVVPNAAGGTIAVWATPDEHRTIKDAVEEMSRSNTAAKVIVYTLKETNASSLVAALQAAVPTARVAVGQNPRKLVVWAKPSEHEMIRATIDELDKEELDGSGNVLKAYTITSTEAPTLLAASANAVCHAAHGAAHARQHEQQDRRHGHAQRARDDPKGDRRNRGLGQGWRRQGRGVHAQRNERIEPRRGAASRRSHCTRGSRAESTETSRLGPAE